LPVAAVRFWDVPQVAPTYKENRIAHLTVAASQIRTNLVVRLGSVAFSLPKMKTSLILGAALAAGANALAIEARQRPKPTSTQGGIPDGKHNVLVIYLKQCAHDDGNSTF
jgi:hypothetical protein